MWDIGTMRVAILDDYQDVALSMADWSDVAARAEITVFTDHLADQDALVERLAPFDVVCVMRERTPLSRTVIERLPQLKMIASTGPFNAAIDVDAAKEHGIYVSTTGGYVESTVELTWALILATARRIVDECLSVRGDGWQTSVGQQLGGTVLGVTYQDASPDSEGFVRRYHLTYPVLRDTTGELAHSFGTRQVPESFIINRQGRIVAISRGEIEQGFVNQALELAEGS